MAAASVSGRNAATAGRRVEHVVYKNVSIEVVVEGQGPAIVLLPSRGRDSYDYDEVAAGLAELGYQVLRPQPRGVGGSVGPMDKLTLHDLADDVAAVVRHYGAAPCVVIGHAFGNWVARMLAVDHPELVRGVVIAAAGASRFPAELSRYVTRSADPALPREERLACMQKIFFAPGNDPSVWLDGWHQEAAISQRRAADATRQEEWWSGGTVPMLDLQADSDPFKPVELRNELKDEFGARVSVALVAGASHALLPEQPAKVVAELAAWLGKLESGALTS